MAHDRADDIPWTSTGRITPAYRVTKSLLPLGILPFDPLPPEPHMPGIAGDSPEAEKYLMRQHVRRFPDLSTTNEGPCLIGEL
jgi:hypothetical protein